MKTDDGIEIEIELTLNVRCSGQNSVFNWFIFLEYSILWQFHGVDLRPFWNLNPLYCCYMNGESVGETNTTARTELLVSTSTSTYIVLPIEREQKTGCHIHNKYWAEVCCKGGGNIFDTKNLQIHEWHWFWTIHFYLDRHTHIHTHLRVEIWIFNIFVKFCVDWRVNASVYSVYANRKDEKCDTLVFPCPCSRNENGIQNTFYVITMRHVVHHFRRISKWKSRKKSHSINGLWIKNNNLNSFCCKLKFFKK